MIVIKKRGRNPTRMLFPFVRKYNPRRCYLSGATFKGQMPWPPPWLHKAKNFNNPKLLPLEIDHLNEEEWDARPENVKWISKVYHVEKSLMSSRAMAQRRIRRG